jgi:hypothetical protein
MIVHPCGTYVEVPEPLLDLHDIGTLIQNVRGHRGFGRMQPKSLDTGTGMAAASQAE